jgi:hypothetical protein
MLLDVKLQNRVLYKGGSSRIVAYRNAKISIRLRIMTTRPFQKYVRRHFVRQSLDGTDNEEKIYDHDAMFCADSC